jgi:hypothetical protein
VGRQSREQVVAKKRAVKKAVRKPSPEKPSPGARMGRPPLPGGAKLSTFTFRTRPEWKDWLGRFAFHCRTDKADVIDFALEAYAKAKGFEGPPKR